MDLNYPAMWIPARLRTSKSILENPSKYNELESQAKAERKGIKNILRPRSSLSAVWG